MELIVSVARFIEQPARLLRVPVEDSELLDETLRIIGVSVNQHGDVSLLLMHQVGSKWHGRLRQEPVENVRLV